MKRILIVDDEPEYSALTKRFLERFNYQIEELTKPSAVMTKLFQNPFDLVLLDYYMPEMRGDEICKKIRKEDRFKDLPVIMITAQYHNLGEEFFKQCGATDVLYKPFPYETLGEKVRACLKDK